ncbi:HNH endonuclease signature motif containing protein [Halomonas sp. MS1]
MSIRVRKCLDSRYAGKRAGTVASRPQYDNYIFRQICIRGITHKEHTLAWAMFYGLWPTKTIDHINHNALDNRVANLREVTLSKNSRNRSMAAHNTSGVTGVSYVKQRGKWRATIKVSGKTRILAYTDCFQEAVAARKKAERELGYHPNFGVGLCPALVGCECD